MVLVVAIGLALTALATRRPRLFRERPVTVLSLGLLLMGFAASLLGIWSGNPIVLVAGAVVRAMGFSWLFVMMGIALLQLDSKVAAMVIAWGFVLKYCWMAAVSALSLEAKLALYIVLPVAMDMVVRSYTLHSYGTLTTSDSRANLEVTSPVSFLPFTHTLFVTIIVFNAASGFSLAFGAVASLPQEPLLSLLPLAVVALMVLALRCLPVDRLCQIATMLILAGLLGILALQSGVLPVDYPWIQTLLTAGADCFSLLAWYVVTRLCARNTVGALPMLYFLYTAQIAGTVLGAGFGHLMNTVIAGYPALVVSIVSLAILLFAGFNLITLKSFSFEATLTQIVPVRSVFIASTSKTLEENCAKVTLEYKLTPREAEIIELLARGRNSQSIQDKLVVSRNTVKTHVKNIYMKLGVHSQQELIDLVERA